MKMILLLALLLASGCTHFQPLRPVGYGCGMVMAIVGNAIIVDIDEPIGTWPDVAYLIRTGQNLYDPVGVILWSDGDVTSARVAGCD